MAAKTWIGNALARRQVQTITVAGTWLSTETATMTMNGKDVVVTLVGDEATTAVATALKEAWMASKRLDGTGTTDATSNAGGQEFGEFSEVSATVSGSVVTLTANKAGIPFTVTVGETSTSGTLTLGTVQTATGPHHWDNGDNWSGGAVPADDDMVIFKDTNICCKYGLPNGTLEVTGQVHQSYTGCIGLPPVNRDDPQRSYYEYRQRFVKLDNNGGGTALTHIFGIGDGAGSPLINWEHTSAADLVVSAVVYNTGTPSPQIPGGKALNLDIDNSGLGGTITIHRGSVAHGVGIEPDVATINVAWTTNQASDVDLSIFDTDANLTLNQTGGNVLLYDQAASTGTRTFNIEAGVCTCRDIQPSGNVTAVITNGKLIYNATKTIASVTIGSHGVLDMEKDSRAVTISACDLFESASLLDEHKRGTYSAGIDLNGCDLPDVTLRLGNNRRLTIGAAA